MMFMENGIGIVIQHKAEQAKICSLSSFSPRQDHLLHGPMVARIQPVEVYSGGYLLTGIIATIPNRTVSPRSLVAGCQGFHPLPLDVEHRHADHAFPGQRVLDRCGYTQRIGEVLEQMVGQGSGRQTDQA